MWISILNPISRGRFQSGSKLCLILWVIDPCHPSSGLEAVPSLVCTLNSVVSNTVLYYSCHNRCVRVRHPASTPPQATQSDENKTFFECFLNSSRRKKGPRQLVQLRSAPFQSIFLDTFWLGKKWIPLEVVMSVAPCFHCFHEVKWTCLDLEGPRPYLPSHARTWLHLVSI